MKKVQLKLSMIFLLFILVFSCENDVADKDNLTLSINERNAIVNLLEADFSSKSNNIVKFSSTELIEIDKVYYLRLFHGESVTTTLLKIDSNNKLLYGGISCTTVSCSSSATGCIPNLNNGCTSCTEGTKDCKRTITVGGGIK
jgi:hypothetical protein